MDSAFNDQGLSKEIDSQRLYFMMNDVGLRKVGISVDPKKRAAQISNASGMKTSVLATWQVSNAFAAEQKIHRHFSHKRKSGEWFEGVTQWDVDDYLNTSIEKSEIQIDPIRFKNIAPPKREAFKMPCVCSDALFAIKSMRTIPKDYDHLKEIEKQQKLIFHCFYPEESRRLLDEIREATGCEIWAADFFFGEPVIIRGGCYSAQGVYFLDEVAALKAKSFILTAIKGQADNVIRRIHDRMIAAIEQL